MGGGDSNLKRALEWRGFPESNFGLQGKEEVKVTLLSVLLIGWTQPESRGQRTYGLDWHPGA